MVKPSAQRNDCSACGLARFLDLPGGITPEQALERAEMNLAFIRTGSIKEIDEAIERIGTAVQSAKAGDRADLFSRIKADANLIYSVGSTFGFAALGAAAAILQQHVESLEQADRADPHELRIYIGALRCLRVDSATTVCREIVDGLKVVSDKWRRKRQGLGLKGGAHRRGKVCHGQLRFRRDISRLENRRGSPVPRSRPSPWEI